MWREGRRGGALKYSVRSAPNEVTESRITMEKGRTFY
jgi:hypothetical protein